MLPVGLPATSGRLLCGSISIDNEKPTSFETAAAGRNHHTLLGAERFSNCVNPTRMNPTLSPAKRCKCAYLKLASAAST